VKTTCGIFLINKNDKTVLLCHPTNASLLQWSIPKGELEKDESPIQRAVKELYNETGVIVKEGDTKIALPSVAYKSSKKRLHPFVLFIENTLMPPRLTCNEMVDDKFPEVDLYVWAPFSLAFQLMHESQSRALRFFLDTYKEYNF